MCLIPVSFPSATQNRQEDKGNFCLQKNKRCSILYKAVEAKQFCKMWESGLCSCNLVQAQLVSIASLGKLVFCVKHLKSTVVILALFVHPFGSRKVQNVVLPHLGGADGVGPCVGCPVGSAWLPARREFAFRAAALSPSRSLGNANPCPCLLAAWLSDLVELVKQFLQVQQLLVACCPSHQRVCGLSNPTGLQPGLSSYRMQDLDASAGLAKQAGLTCRS